MCQKSQNKHHQQGPGKTQQKSSLMYVSAQPTRLSKARSSTAINMTSWRGPRQDALWPQTENVRAEALNCCRGVAAACPMPCQAESLGDHCLMSLLPEQLLGKWKWKQSCSGFRSRRAGLWLTSDPAWTTRLLAKTPTVTSKSRGTLDERRSGSRPAPWGPENPVTHQVKQKAL